MRKLKILLLVLLVCLISGCATTQVIRKAQYLSTNYSSQTNKKIVVISLIDAREDKTNNTQELLSNSNVISFFVLNPLKRRGYTPYFINTNTSKCSSLYKIANIKELSCLDENIFKDGDLFMLISIDKYIAAKGMKVAGYVKVSGALYSRITNDFIWKDSIEGNYGGAGIYYGLGGYAGMLILKGMSADCIFRNNVFTAIDELIKSIPEFSTKH